MSETFGRRHEHHGRSSRSFLDSRKILEDIGIDKAERFADLGSGEGYFSLEAAKAVGEDGWVYAFDTDADSIATLKKEIEDRKLANIEASVADISKSIPLADESISLVFMSNVLHGLVANNETDGTFKEIARTTTQTGRLAIVEFKKRQSPMGPPLSIRLGPDEVEALAKVYGFSRDRVLEAGQYHYCIIFRKNMS